MKLATTTGDFVRYTDSQIEALAYIREAGFRYVDYNFNPDYNRKNGVFSEDFTAYVAALKTEADRLGLTFVQAHTPMGDPIQKGNEAFAEATARCIEVSAALGIENIVVHTGYERGLSREETFARNEEFFRPLLEKTDALGVNILVENFNKMCIDGLYWIDNAADLLALIKKINHPRLHAVFDTGHDNMQDTPPEKAIRTLGHHLYALHVQDNSGDDDSHMMPFYGTLDVDSLMRGLRSIGYEGYFTFECGSMMHRHKSREIPLDAPPLAKPPLSLRIAEEKLLYEIGRTILSAYGAYEE